MTRDEILRLARRIGRGHELTRGEALRLAGDETALDDLMAGASLLMRTLTGGEVEFCAIVNARAGRCPNDCTFCAQSAHYETPAPAYGLLGTDEIVAAARGAAVSGACRFGIVTSGPAVEDDADFERVCQTVRAVAALGTLRVCASLGTLTPGRARRLKTAGLSRYHHNLETSRGFYPRICTTQDYGAKIETLRAARDAGLEVCAGGLFGLGETWDDRIEMAMTLREIGVGSVPINFLLPVPGTPLEARQKLSPGEALRIVAVYRFIFPRGTVKVCGGREAVLAGRQPEMFRAGANGAIIGDYLTTAGRPPADDLEMAAALGLRVRTHSPSKEPT